MLVNCDKTNVMLFGAKQRLARSKGFSLFLLDKLLELPNTVKHTRLFYNDEQHLVVKYRSRRLNLLERIGKYAATDTSKLAYMAYVQPHVMEYCDLLWPGANSSIVSIGTKC